MDKGDQQSGGEPKNPMTKEDAARIQSSYVKPHGAKSTKKASLQAPRLLQPSMKTRVKKEEPNSLAVILKDTRY